MTTLLYLARAEGRREHDPFPRRFAGRPPAAVNRSPVMAIRRTNRGRAWVLAQTGLFLAIATGPALERRERSPFAAAAGATLMLGALGWMGHAYRSLGASHTPWVEPILGGGVATDGAYGIVRHPIYAGWVGLSVGWGLLTGSRLVLVLSAILALFYDRRARLEERLMEQAHPDYAGYRQRVRRFVPGVY